MRNVEALLPGVVGSQTLQRLLELRRFESMEFAPHSADHNLVQGFPLGQ